jgi:hypothetical protein
MTDSDEFTAPADWPEPVINDTGRIVEHVGPFAEQMIRQDGAVWPVGAGITQDIQLEPITVAPEPGDSVQTAMDRLIAAVTSAHDDYRAICLTTAVTLPDDTDAIHITIEHATGQAAAFLCRYRQRGILNHIFFDDPVWVPLQPDGWTDQTTA